ncbi:MAG: glutaredoxin family protein [Pseudomonadota bacterium]
MKELVLYSRPGCHLCENLLEELLPLLRGRAGLREVNIDTDPALRAQFDVRVPVLAAGEDVISEAFLDRDAVQAYLQR